MKNFLIDIKGLQETLDAVNRVKDSLGSETPDITVKHLAEFALESLKRLTPRGKTGTIRNLWKVLYGDEGGGRMTAQLYHALARGSEVWSAALAALEYGVGPHRKRIRNKQVMHFTWMGQEIFAKDVYLRGFRGFGMVSETVRRLDKVVERAYDIAFGKIKEQWEK